MTRIDDHDDHPRQPAAARHGHRPRRQPLDQPTGPADRRPLPHDDVRFRRPEGLTDLQWQKVKDEAQGFIEWQIEKAVRGS